jgi:hypothetical protein
MNNNLELIRHKVEQYHESKSVRFTHRELIIMSLAHLELEGSKVNLSCNPCVTKALDKLYTYLNVKEVSSTLTYEELDKLNHTQLWELGKPIGAKYARSKDGMIESILKVF